MRALPLLLILAFVTLSSGCPKSGDSTASGAAIPVPDAYAILIADAEGARPPAIGKVELTAGGGVLLLISGPPDLIDRPPEGWRRWTRIGFAEQRAKLGDARWLLDAAAAGREWFPVVITLARDADDEVRPEVTLRDVLIGAGASIKVLHGREGTAQVNRGSFGALLALPDVLSIALDPAPREPELRLEIVPDLPTAPDAAP